MLGLKAGLIGTLCVGAGAWMLFSEARHSLTGVHATAVLVERVTECKAEFQPVGESRRKEAMPCDQAEAFRAVADAAEAVEANRFGWHGHVLMAVASRD